MMSLVQGTILSCQKPPAGLLASAFAVVHTHSHFTFNSGRGIIFKLHWDGFRPQIKFPWDCSLFHWEQKIKFLSGLWDPYKLSLFHIQGLGCSWNLPAHICLKVFVFVLLSAYDETPKIAVWVSFLISLRSFLRCCLLLHQFTFAWALCFNSSFPSSLFHFAT